MKTEFQDVSETQKKITIEIPSDVVDAEIDRVAKGYSKQARLPGFRPGKVPSNIIKQRFREEIHHEVMHGLIPRAIEEALQERGIEPVSTPDIKDVSLREGEPLKFTADVETVPPFDPGDLSTITLRQHSSTVTEDAVEKTLERLRERGAKFETVEGRPLSEADTAVVDLDRTDPDGKVDHHEGVSIELGAAGNPPGFDQHLLGMNAAEEKTFVIHFPDDYAVKDMANTDVTYKVTVKEIRRKVLPLLDDEFAKDVGDFESLATLRDRVRADMQAEAEQHAKQHVRSDLLKQLGQRIGFELPPSLVDKEIERRLEEFARRLMDQGVDPRKAGIDWSQFREAQREPARDAVASALVLDEIARRENLTVTSADVDKELEQFASASGRTPAALRAQLEKEGGVVRLTAGLRREKAVDFAMSHAKMTTD
ncbi:MAG: trigger factor [Acidobacteria bacterium]|nr:MAG: trigger factor [Acidobacteriota bacterium]PYR78788.1 MAG: trigger factor [Acidobacteriota bacterium]